ncbi:MULTISPECIES: S9 family peptidase [unclassified Wenzhouxiangella]|uniref:alpha/beta hydrolase family protein n=1 Tax=unclassified Wenzhouxiangella TaxID=2613841 RepID=UPI000E32ACC3|nr:MULTISPECIES: S9 family peptidase [unclassified Wenzhouxiangella]RFF27009.1 S9 family peptidase [Wenzhouxiangella sp. 15181]RFP69520.1 S9 family peptidase [Wenzhouxiangella sp. 15190]
MPRVLRPLVFCVLAGHFLAASALADETTGRLSSADLFDLQYASEVRISPDGERVVYTRSIHDIMCDCVRSNLWIVDSDGDNHQPLLSGRGSYSSPRWSPSGDRLAYVAKDEADKTQLYVRWIESGQTAMVSNLVESPSSIAWSPSGESIAFTMRVPAEKPSLADPPKKPEGADWAPEPVVIDSVVYRYDGRGYIDPGFDHIFVVPADGGAARQLTSGDFNHHGPLSWMPDGSGIVFSGNRAENWQYERNERDLYSVNVESGDIEQLTDLPGIEGSPAVSPDGERIVFERDDHQGRQYSINSLGLVDAEGGNLEILGEDLDRSIESPVWSGNGQSIYFHYTDRGWRKVGRIDLDGDIDTVVDGINGTTVGRPYRSGDFSVADDGRIAYTLGTEKHPADVWVQPRRGDARRLTRLNRNLLDQRALGEVHEIVYESSVDGTDIQGWYLTPPDFDPEKQYPLILEIHGGPHLAYGPHFSAEMQRMAAEGYVVFYDNHRGSSGYGRDFGMLLEYKYASEEDFGDHMSGVDTMIDKGFVDPDRLFVTGGSAGGIAAAYAIGLTDRFRAAAVAKPVINWISKTLTGDIYTTQIEHQFPGLPWEEFEHYWKRSPLSLVGNVTTPTLLITGEDDFRTPISETEQYYQALKLQRVDTVMVRLPESPHGIAGRPSRLIAKVDNILAWFERHDEEE